MDPMVQLEEVVGLLGKLGVVVRYEHLGGDGGGMCQIRSDRVLFVDLDADIATTTTRALEALASVPESADLPMPPEIRSRLDALSR